MDDLAEHDHYKDNDPYADLCFVFFDEVFHYCKGTTFLRLTSKVPTSKVVLADPNGLHVQ